MSRRYRTERNQGERSHRERPPAEPPAEWPQDMPQAEMPQMEEPQAEMPQEPGWFSRAWDSTRNSVGSALRSPRMKYIVPIAGLGALFAIESCENYPHVRGAYCALNPTNPIEKVLEVETRSMMPMFDIVSGHRDGDRQQVELRARFGMDCNGDGKPSEEVTVILPPQTEREAEDQLLTMKDYNKILIKRPDTEDRLTLSQYEEMGSISADPVLLRRKDKGQLVYVADRRFVKFVDRFESDIGYTVKKTPGVINHGSKNIPPEKEYR